MNESLLNEWPVHSISRLAKLRTLSQSINWLLHEKRTKPSGKQNELIKNDGIFAANGDEFSMNLTNRHEIIENSSFMNAAPVKEMRARARATCHLKSDANDAHVIHSSRHQKRPPWKPIAISKRRHRICYTDPFRSVRGSFQKELPLKRCGSISLDRQLIESSSSSVQSHYWMQYWMVDINLRQLRQLRRWNCDSSQVD